MTQFKALYYPSFEPPAAWLRSFLLFFDKINSIVPKDAKYSPSRNILEITDLIPDVFETIAPDEKDIEIDNLNFSRLRKAFEIIKKEQPKKHREQVKITIDHDGSIGIADHVFLHDAKISDNIRSLLEEFELIRPELSEIAASSGTRNFSVVNENASDLIVSHLADKISRRHGWNTISDKPIDFIINRLNSFSYKSINEPETMLACSIITCEIPHEIKYVPPKRYKEIRDVYSDIRQPFHYVVNQLSSIHRLDKIEDKQLLQERIQEITREFSLEMGKIKKSDFGCMIKRWTPIGIGGITSLISAAFTEPSVAITSASVSFLIQVVQKMTDLKESESEQKNVQRLIGRLKKDIIDASEIRRLI